MAYLLRNVGTCMLLPVNRLIARYGDLISRAELFEIVQIGRAQVKCVIDRPCHYSALVTLLRMSVVQAIHASQRSFKEGLYHSITPRGGTAQCVTGVVLV